MWYLCELWGQGINQGKHVTNRTVSSLGTTSGFWKKVFSKFLILTLSHNLDFLKIWAMVVADGY